MTGPLMACLVPVPSNVRVLTWFWTKKGYFDFPIKHILLFYQYKVSYDELLHRTLWLAVWNHDRFGHNDFLGEVLIPIDEYRQSGFSLEDPEPQWYHLCERVRREFYIISYFGHRLQIYRVRQKKVRQFDLL